MPSSLAAQLYTLRDFTKTPSDIATTLARVKKIGYDAVQCSALGPIDAAELAKILRNEGLTCCATHTGLDRLRDHTQQVIDEHRMWGCEYTAIGGFFQPTTAADEWVQFARSFNDVARKFAGSGVEIGYHNHSHELIRYGGKTAMQILVDQLDPSVWFEIDTYWITHGGGDPSAWIRKVAKRIPCVHLKDMLMSEKREQQMAEVGEGNLNWPGIFEACQEAGVKWFIVEQDVCQRDPFESLTISLRNLKAMGMS